MFTLSSFPDKREKEKIIFLLRRHWFILLKQMLFYSGLLLIPLVLSWLFNQFWPGALENEILYTLTVLGVSIYYLFIWLFFFHAWLDWWLDVWIVTEERIINIEQKGLFSRTIATQKLNRVQDVTSQVQGLFPTFLGYGDVHIQTAGPEERFVFEEIPHPQKIAQEILKLVEKCKP